MLKVDGYQLEKKRKDTKTFTFSHWLENVYGSTMLQNAVTKYSVSFPNTSTFHRWKTENNTKTKQE